MAGTLGTIRGQISLDVKQALAAYTAVRLANLATTTALTRSASAFAIAGRGMTIAGLAMAAGFGYAIKAAADFEKKLDFFGAVSDTSVADMGRIRDKALELGRDTRYSAGEIADSFVELGKAGIPASTIIDGVGLAVANLGAAADIPLDKAANIMASATQTFSLAGKDAVHVADLLAGAANASIVEIDDLGVSLKYVGGVAAAISIPIEDTVDAIALLGKYGIKGSMAGTSLRQMLVSLNGGSKKATALLKDMGIITKEGGNQFFNAQGKAKPLAEIFQLLQDKTKGMTEAQRLAAFKTIFNNRALAAAAVLTREGAAGFDKMNKEIAKTTAADVAAKRLDNLSGDIEILKGNLETLFIQAGTPLQEFFRGIVQGITKLTQWFGQLSPETQQAAFKFLAISAAVLLFLGTVAKILAIIFRFIRVMQELWSIIRLVWAVIRPLVMIIRTVGAVMAAVASGPVALIIAAIIAVVAVFILLWNKSEAFRNFFIGLWGGITSGFNTFVEFFKSLPETFSSVMDSVTSGLISAWDAVFSFFTVTVPGWFSSMVSSVTTTLSGWGAAFVAFWVALPGRIGSALSSMVSAVGSFFSRLPGLAGYWLGFMIGRSIRMVIDFGLAMGIAIRNMVTAIISFFAQLPGRVISFVSSMVVKSIALFNSLRTRALALASQIISGLVTWFAKLPGRIAAYFSAVYTTSIGWLGRTAASAISKAGQIYNGIINWIGKLPGRIAGFFQSLYTGAISKLGSLVGAAANMGRNIYNGLIDWISKIPGAVTGAIGNAIGAFRDMVAGAFRAAQEFAAGLWNGFKEGLGINSPSFIEKQMVQITEVVGQETAALRNQVRKVQGLGSRLTNIPTMTPNDQTLTSGYANSLISNMTKQATDLRAMEQALSRTALDAMLPASARNSLAISQAALTATPSSTQPIIPPRPTGPQRIIGELTLTEDSRVMISGVAEDVYINNQQFESSIDRMGRG